MHNKAKAWRPRFDPPPVPVSLWRRALPGKSPGPVVVSARANDATRNHGKSPAATLSDNGGASAVAAVGKVCGPSSRREDDAAPLRKTAPPRSSTITICEGAGHGTEAHPLGGSGHLGLVGDRVRNNNLRRGRLGTNALCETRQYHWHLNVLAKAVLLDGSALVMPSINCICAIYWFS